MADASRGSATDGETARALSRFAHGITSSLMAIQSRVRSAAAAIENDPLHRSLAETELLIEDLRFQLGIQSALPTWRDQDLRIVQPHEIHRAISRAAERCSLGHPTVEVRVLEASAAPVLAGWEYLCLVIGEIIGNAASYATSQSKCSVSVSWIVDGDKVRIRFADRGPGVEDQPRTLVFEDGYRGRSARAHKPGGLGRGLHVARELCRGMNGDLKLVDAPNGAIFEVALPTP